MLRWTKKEKRLVLELADEKLAQEIADELENKGYRKCTADAVRGVIRRYGFENSKYTENEPKKSEVVENEQKLETKSIGIEFEKALVDMAKLRTQAIHEITDYTEIIGNHKNANYKVLSISDTHIPFYHDGVVSDAVKKHGDADVLVLNGDLLELHSVSSWPKSKQIILRHEYKIAMAWLCKLAKIFPKIVLVKGNHEDRLQRYFQSNIDPNVSFMTNPDILDRLANGYDFDNKGALVQMHELPNVHYTKGGLSWFARIGKCIFAHPSGGSSIPMRTAVNTANYFIGREYDFDSVVIGHCFDEETELLTDQGWKDIDTIKEKDNPLTLNLDSNKLEFNNCEGIHKYSDHKELIAFENNTGLEVLVTPEHGMLYSTARNLGKDSNEKWNKANAQEIETYVRFSIPASGILNNPENGDIPDATLKLLAWIVTEGNIEFTSANNPVIRIAQSDDESGFLYEIEALIQMLKIEYSKTQRYKANTYKHGIHRNYDAYRFYIGVEGSSYLAKYLDLQNKTFNHDLLISLSLRQRQLLIEEMCKGDGSKCGTDHYCHYYTSNKILLDQFQLLCTLSGIRNKANIKREDGTWVVSMTKTALHTVISTERREYSGRTWCLTVPNGTLVARRKGVVFLTQNTHKMGTIIWNNKLLIEQGCACVPLEYESTSKMTYRPQAFGYAVIYMDKEGNVDFDKSGPVYYGTGSLTPNDALEI